MTTGSRHSPLTDRFGRRIDYLRLSVTDRCNLRCFYCLPGRHRHFEARDHCLSFEEIEQVVGAFAELGVHRVRITGGEPLVRRDLPTLVARLTALPGVEDLSLSTNASLLAGQAQDLYRAGIRHINVSLDSLDPVRFKEITGGTLATVLAGLRAAKSTGFAPIKINMLALRGVNDDEFEAMVDFCLEHDFTLRFIETMPMGPAGRRATNHYLDLKEVRSALAQRYTLLPSVMPGAGPARYAQIQGSDLRIGFITPISQHFCATCNRVRLSADGTIYMCLGQDACYPLRARLRAGADRAELFAAIREAIELKPERHEFRTAPGKLARLMSMTGG